MAQINLKQLEAFVQVADLGSFRRAAEALGTTQPNISTRIASLEAQLGIKLLDRDAGSVRLTPKGGALLAKARQVLQSLDEFLVAADDDSLFEGTLRLGVTEMVVHSWLGTYLAALKERFPNIDIDLTVDLSAVLSDALFSRSIDLALQSGPFNRPTTGALDLGSYPFVWVASKDLGIGHEALTLRDLAAFPILTHARGTLPYEQLNEHVATQSVRVRLVASTNMVACIQMTLEGLGVACLPAIMVQDLIEAGKLVRLPYDWCPDDLSFYARFDADTSAHFVAEAALVAEQISQAATDKG